MTLPMEERCRNWQESLSGLPYASIVPARTPAVKYHGKIGLAKSAVGYEVTGLWDYSTRSYKNRGARGGEIHVWTESGWNLLYRVEAGTPTGDLPWRAPVVAENDCE